MKTVSSLTKLGSVLSKFSEIEILSAGLESSFLSTESVSHDVSLNLKIDVQKSVVLTSLLYAEESWIQYNRYLDKLDAFHMLCLNTIYRKL